jgi:hypothetical protein
MQSSKIAAQSDLDAVDRRLAGAGAAATATAPAAAVLRAPTVPLTSLPAPSAAVIRATSAPKAVASDAHLHVSRTDAKTDASQRDGPHDPGLSFRRALNASKQQPPPIVLFPPTPAVVEDMPHARRSAPAVESSERHPTSTHPTPDVLPLQAQLQQAMQARDESRSQLASVTAAMKGLAEENKSLQQKLLGEQAALERSRHDVAEIAERLEASERDKAAAQQSLARLKHDAGRFRGDLEREAQQARLAQKDASQAQEEASQLIEALREAQDTIDNQQHEVAGLRELLLGATREAAAMRTERDKAFAALHAVSAKDKDVRAVMVQVWRVEESGWMHVLRGVSGVGAEPCPRASPFMPLLSSDATSV